ncbi:orotate phosphoribosyltransferase [Metallibacterium sp.]|uniref:orotate phosphoribosyltransferase n=1 Tax=Metallibacterium sp. TaxID=2940281 RepID=UPI002615D58B|nr:orotate phosphoribosyltransferase [Metallibacterium sp.]
MHAYQQDFLALAHAAGVLRFGSFTLKSGRQSPYFFNLGQIATGARLERLGAAYAACIEASGMGFDMLFGPAYKGIPLVTATAIALAERHGRDVPLAYNRKEAKNHGEGGVIVGAALSGRVLVIDDVLTAGTAVRESLVLIRAHGATPVGVVIALNRQERGRGTRSAAQDLTHEHGLPVLAIVGLNEIMDYVSAQPELATIGTELATYRARYGVA